MRRTASSRLPAVLLLATLLLPSIVVGQGGFATVRFVPIEPFDDLLFSNVDGAFDAVVDPDTGHLWYTTGGGLVHVNAERTARRVLAVAEGLPTPLLYDIQRAPDGMLWIGSDAGLVRVDPATEAVTFWNPAVDPAAPAFIVSTVFPDPYDPDAVWVGTQQKGIARFRPATNEWEGPWNTSVERNHPILSISATADAVYFAARTSGVLRYDRESGVVAPVHEPERWAFETANAVLADGELLWVGTDAGLWRRDPANATGPWFRFNGSFLSDVRVQDIDRDEEELWMATRTGVTVYNLTTERWSYLGTGHGLLHNNVRRIAFADDLVLFSTLRGLSVLDLSERRVANFVTGETNGPNSNSLLGGAGHGGRVWFGTTDGVSAFDPATQKWLSLGIVDGIDVRSMPVYDVTSDGERLWLATAKYVWMFNGTGEPPLKIVDDYGSNVYFHVEVDGDTLWLPEWNTGLIEYDWVRNVTRRYDFTNSGLFDWLVSDVHATEDAVWVATFSGLYKMDKLTRLFTNVYAETHGFPSAELSHVWPDGRDLWIATRESGLVRFNTETARVTAVYNETNGGLPGGTVRDLVKDGTYLWLAMGDDGLVRLDFARRTYEQWRQPEGMPENHANGVVLKDGIVYVGTHAGMARLDTRTMTFLPMHVADPAAWLAANPVAGGPASSLEYAPSVRIESPSSGSAATGLVTFTGRASRPGGAVERVEVAIGDGPWQPADGTARWTFTWDSSAVAPGDYVVKARAVSGSQTSREDAITLAIVALPETPLAIVHTPPEGAAFSNRSLRIAADVRGDAPLSARVFYQSEGESGYRELRLERRHGLWVADVPAEHARDGAFRYFIEATSGLLSRTAPEDRREPFVLTLRPAPPTSVSIQGPPGVEVQAGASTTFTLTVENVGRHADTYVVETTGVRASWATLDATPFRLEPGQRAERSVTVAAPARAFADSAALTFVVRPVASVADPARASVPLTVLPGEPDAPAVEVQQTRGFFGFIPGPGVALALLAACALALVHPRRRFL